MRLGHCIACGAEVKSGGPLGQGTLYFGPGNCFVVCNTCARTARWVLEVGDGNGGVQRVVVFEPVVVAATKV